jgi:hypothetical protein
VQAVEARALGCEVGHDEGEEGEGGTDGGEGAPAVPVKVSQVYTGGRRCHVRLYQQRKGGEHELSHHEEGGDHTQAHAAARGRHRFTAHRKQNRNAAADTKSSSKPEQAETPGGADQRKQKAANSIEQGCEHEEAAAAEAIAQAAADDAAEEHAEEHGSGEQRLLRIIHADAAVVGGAECSENVTHHENFYAVRRIGQPRDEHDVPASGGVKHSRADTPRTHHCTGPMPMAFRHASIVTAPSPSPSPSQPAASASSLEADGASRCSSS